MRRVQTFHPIESEGDKIVPELTTGSSKRDAEVELDHEGSKKQKTNEASGSVQEQPKEEETELPQEDLQQMMMIVPVEEVYVEALQVKYPIIDWEVYSEDTRRYWKIIRVELKRLLESDNDDTIWKLQRERLSVIKRSSDVDVGYQAEEMDLETAQLYYILQSCQLSNRNGSQFNLQAKTTNADGTSTTLIPGPVTTEEKYKDAKTLFAAIQTRFGGNEATKKTQKTLLKQMYENFSAPSTESLDSILNRLQNISASDGNTLLCPASTQVSTASTQVSTANLSDDTVYAFFASQPNGSQIVYEDLEQIHEDDIEEIDLKWQLALLSTRTRRGPRNQDSRNRNQDSSKRTVNMEEISSKAMLAIDGAGLFSPSNLDLSNSGLEEFQQPEFKGYGLKTSKNVSEDTSNEVRESHDALMVEKLVSGDKLKKKTVFPTVAKIEFVRAKQQEKPIRKPVKYAEMYRPKAVNTARPNSVVVNAVRANQVNVVKASACSVWRPTKLNRSSTKKDQGYVESRCSRHMTWNMSYLLDFKEFDRGYVTFGGGAKGGEITADESQVLLKVPRKNNMYSVDMKNIIPKESLTCLVAKATLDESMLWHRRLDHVNFKTINKLVKKNLVRGLPSKRFENDQTCVACLKGKQHKASFVTDDYSRFTWVFFLASKDETSGILKSFITEKGIKREFSVARTPQQNVAEKRNRTLIEADRTMLADSNLPTTSWAEAVNTTCYVQNMVLVVKPHNKTPYELFRGRTPTLSFIRPFGCHVTILNTLDNLGKFDCKSDEGFFIGYSLNSKAFRVYNIRTRKVEESLHIRFLEDKPIIDVLTKSMNYVPVVVGTNSNDFTSTEESISACHSSKETGSSQDYILMPLDAGKKDDEGSGVQTRRMTKTSNEQGFISAVYEGENTYEDFILVYLLDKYVDEILKKFGFSTVMTASTPMETSKSLLKDAEAKDVDVHLYRSMIRSLIIFRYLKGQPKLGLWYPKDSPSDFEAYTDSDYAGASLDRKSTTGVLWIQNQMLDYGYNFMNTKIFIDNEITICIVKNLVFHSKTKHIEIRDSSKKKLIQMIKIHTDHNVADLLTKAFDVGRFQYLIASVGMLNP
ncbi:putative ribonuclease H-like domain-containing protein [Tanacetum coccineum]